jgi:hypothetical protein
MIKNLKLLYQDKGFIICFILSIIVLVAFFGNVLFQPNTVYFGNSGDGLQTYYNSLYHVLYDDSYIYQEAMNYPYKESVFFTACQPMVTNFIRFFGLQSYTIGILNLTLLFSLPIGVWFLYFTMKELKINYLIAAVGAVAIGYFTPQIARFNSHYTLAYSFAIPAIIYLAIRFYKSPSLKKSLAISFLVFFMASTHMYFFVFYALILTWVWCVFLYVKGIKNNLLLFIKHYTIQLIIPLALLQIIIFILNDYTDRTNHPGGFLVYISNWSGVFYPYGRYYEYLFKNNNLESIEVNWEGIAFVGLGATIIALLFFLKLIRNILNLDFKNIFRFTSSSVLNGLIICGIVSLLYSFGWPFIFGNEDLVSKMGFLKQIRSLGRFAWIFFYIINIALIFVLNEIPNKYNKFHFKTLLTAFVLFVLSYDAYINIRYCNTELNNKIVELNDTNNKMPENAWLKSINVNDFQAILPLPYFHIGSENINIEPKGDIHINSYIASLKTGLPIITVMGARVSLEQTYNNLELVKEPNGKIPIILSKFKNDKGILLVLKKEFLNSEYEKLIVDQSDFITETPKFSLHSIAFKKLVEYYKSHAKKKIESLKHEKLFERNGYKSNDSLNNYIVNDFTKRNLDSGFATSGSLKGIPKNYFTIFNDSLTTNINDSLFTFSFWINNIRADQSMSLVIGIEAYDDGVVYNAIFTTLQFNIKQLNGSWGLIECNFKLHKSNNRVKAVLWNPNFDITKKMEVDEVLFRPSKTNVSKEFTKFMLINNCIYYHD